MKNTELSTPVDMAKLVRLIDEHRERSSAYRSASAAYREAQAKAGHLLADMLSRATEGAALIVGDDADSLYRITIEDSKQYALSLADVQVLASMRLSVARRHDALLAMAKDLADSRVLTERLMAYASANGEFIAL